MRTYLLLYLVSRFATSVAQSSLTLKAMKFPEAVVKFLHKKGIKKPTAIQAQGLPCVLSGRDMIGIANTGSGKTMVSFRSLTSLTSKTFILPSVLFALEEELKLPAVYGEGPFSLILVPSRELADQIYHIVSDCFKFLERCARIKGMRLNAFRSGYPRLNVSLVMGGTQTERSSQGVHVVVATPGRLIDMLNKEKMTLAFCKLFCLDEGDRMLDGIFAVCLILCLASSACRRI